MKNWAKKATIIEIGSIVIEEIFNPHYQRKEVM